VKNAAYEPCYHLKTFWKGTSSSLILMDWALGPHGKLGPDYYDKGYINGSVVTLPMGDWRNVLPWGTGTLQVCLTKGEQIVRCGKSVPINRPCAPENFPWNRVSVTKANDNETIEVVFPEKAILTSLQMNDSWPDSMTDISVSLVVGYPGATVLDYDNSFYTLRDRDGDNLSCKGHLMQGLDEKYKWFLVSPAVQGSRMIFSENSFGMGKGCVSHVGAIALQATLKATFRDHNGHQVSGSCVVVSPQWLVGKER